ncbi:hypothetical protein NH8B_3086 [Pseudogulbenkiania sp. NH8B]|uniref:hypothetical protein n=1 Tax=Pseudogulbenkiania sp. (strain NH8B) TaxID=748280 RepID=UPI0002279FB0|nr:hypothetical protein [Pseudogulbenkiania sp. NH8B]BAK77867.1 hypothetical protein NH8B_3086 [Pseudogulbenkiania sp. NH8B]
MRVTPKMSVHFDVPYGAREQDVYLPPRPEGPGMAALPAEVFSQTVAEYRQWAQYLDELAQRARQGQDEEARALARGKLKFLRRRVELLREEALLSAVRDRLPLVQALYQLTVELGQVVMELTGRMAPALDEWPLPYRLYSRGRQAVADAAPAPVQDEGASAPVRERRAVARKQGNRLEEEERQDVAYVVAGVRFIHALVQGWHVLEQAAGIGDIEHSLQMSERLAA